MSKVAQKRIEKDASGKITAIITPKSYSYVSAENFAFVTEPTEVTFNPPESVEDALNRLPTDPKRCLKLLTGLLSREAFFAARNSIESKGLDAQIVSKSMAGFRNMPPFSTMYKKDAAGNVMTDKEGAKIVDYDAQTKAIAEMFTKSPSIVESIKLASEQAREDGDDETETTE